MKYFYFSIQHSLRVFLINKKIVFTEKRHRIKNSKIRKRIWMKPCSKTRSDKSTVQKNFANFTGKHLCWSLFFTKLQAFRPAALLKKTPTLVFSCEIWEILKNTYFEEHLNDCFCVLITSSYIDFYSTRFSFLQISSSLLRN